MAAGRKPTVSDEEILDVFQQSPDPVLTTRDVAEAIDMGRRGTYQRLEDLAESGTIQKKKVGETGAVWWSDQALKQRFSNE
ncbi:MULTISPECIES: winged helix-turn-helix domain-containing protein [Halolamina]|uniref:winged helix-turn-helix domain-containing protein n=1 Tax=Halolamina TaxID=1075397 RepID=UPI000942631A|nr:MULTISPECIES: winged helix-turn-helix domain-containing protein [Halolamina]NHX37272.1 winged helix-turn-helix domain-containing protein [Halolamina sp. R1-12]